MHQALVVALAHDANDRLGARRADDEPALAAELTHQAEPAMRGTAAGVFNTVQFFGVFLGGVVAAGTLRHDGANLFPVLGGLMVAWLAVAWRFLGSRRASAAS